MNIQIIHRSPSLTGLVPDSAFAPRSARHVFGGDADPAAQRRWLATLTPEDRKRVSAGGHEGCDVDEYAFDSALRVEVETRDPETGERIRNAGNYQIVRAPSAE